MQHRFPAPRTPRDLIELFALYEQGGGINAVMNAVDFTGMDRPAVLAAVLGRGPSARREQPTPDDYNPRAHMRNLLSTQEFRDRARPLILKAFPEKRRAIFVHIPKCAGTDMTDTMRARYPTLREATFSAAAGLPPEALFSALRAFALGIRHADTIAVSGHERLAYYQQQRLVRARDWLFTMVRDPVALIYSNVSYVLTICQTAPQTKRPDGLEWLRMLGLEEIPADIGQAGMVDLVRRVLFHPKLTWENNICRFLGDGTAESALARIVASNIEITDTSRYAAWRRAAFPGAPETRANASIRFFAEDMASARDRARVAALTQEDRKLFGVIQAALERSGGLSVKGSELT